MAPIGVQLVKDVLRLVNGTGWQAQGRWRPGHFTPDAIMRAGRGSGLWLALTGYHRDRRECGAGRLRWLPSPGRRPERNSSHRQQDEGLRKRVGWQILRPAAPTPDPRCAGTDAVHVLTSRHLRRPVRGSPGRLRRPSRAGRGGAANTSPTIPQAQRMRATAVSG